MSFYARAYWMMMGLATLLVVTDVWKYRLLHAEYVALEQRLNTIIRLSDKKSVKTASPAGDGWKVSQGALDARVVQLQGQITSLQQTVSRLDQKMVQLAAWQQTASNPSQDTTLQFQSSVEDDDGPSTAERAQELLESYSQEERADEWAVGVETAVHTVFNTLPELTNVYIDEVDCRTTVCRLTWDLAVGLSSEEYFILENEILAAIGKAGLNQGSLVGGGNKNEGYFFRKETSDAPLPNEE